MIEIKDRIRVYVAGPYTHPDPCLNTHRAIKLADDLLNMGYAPFVPHLSLFWHTMIPHTYEQWMELDFAFVDVCDVLFRMHGESKGADREVERANEMNIPVVQAVGQLSGIFPVDSKDDKTFGWRVASWLERRGGLA